MNRNPTDRAPGDGSNAQREVFYPQSTLRFYEVREISVHQALSLLGRRRRWPLAEDSNLPAFSPAD